MMFRTHVLFALLIGIIFHSFSNGQWPVFFPLILISAGLPDLDNSQSKFGRKLKFLSWFFKHRGIFHSLFFVFVISLLGWWFFGNVVFWGLFLGSLSHLIADGFTLSGVNLLYPFKQLKLKGFVKTNGMMESAIFYLLLIIDAALLINIL